MFHDYLISTRDSVINGVVDVRPFSMGVRGSIIVVHFCSAPVGSGKTHRLIDRAVDLVHAGERVIIAAPTKRLAEHIRRSIEQHVSPERMRIFHNESVPHPAHELVEYSRDAYSLLPQVLIVTHQVLPHVTTMENRGAWHLLIDEVLQVNRCERRDRIPVAHRLLTDEVEISEGDGMHRIIRPRSAKRVLELARRRDDEIIEQYFSESLRLLVSPAWDCYVRASRYEELLRDGGDGSLEVQSILRPDVIAGFKSVFIAGARFEHSLMREVWGRMGVEFIRDDRFEKSLRYSRHECGPLVSIGYATGCDVSRGLLDAEAADGRRNIEALRDGASRFMEDDPYLWMANLRVLDDFMSGDRVPCAPYGLNDYSHFHHAAVLSSTNPTPGHFTFMREQFGIDGAALKRALVHDLAYQMIGRTSVRDPQCRAPKRQFVPDCATALSLADEFKGCSLELVECGVRSLRSAGRPRMNPSAPMTAAERVRRWRMKQRGRARTVH